MKTHTVLIKSDSYPQVTMGKKYSVDRINDHQMVFLIGITNPVPLSACEFVEPDESTVNTFVVTKQYLVVEEVLMSNAVGSRELVEGAVLEKTLHKSCVMFSKQIDSVSKHVLDTMK